MQRPDLSFEQPLWSAYVSEINAGVVNRRSTAPRGFLGDIAARDGTDYVVRFMSGKRTRVVVEADGCNRPHAAYTLEIDPKHRVRGAVDAACLLTQLALEEVARFHPPLHPTRSPHAPRVPPRRVKHASCLAQAAWCRRQGDHRGAHRALERARFFRVGGAS